MPRSILDESRIHTAIQERVASHQQAIVKEVQGAVAQHAVVVVGMGMNPFPKQARKLLDDAGIAYHYLTYGTYFSRWREKKRLETVDRLAHLSDGVRQRHPDWGCQ